MFQVDGIVTIKTKISKKITTFRFIDVFPCVHDDDSEVVCNKTFDLLTGCLGLTDTSNKGVQDKKITDTLPLTILN